MLRVIILGVAVMLLVGCANYNQMMINKVGEAKVCASSGVGLIPMYQAEQAFKSCVAGLKSVGFLEVERAGVVGIAMSADKDDIRISKVEANSPQE